MLSVRSSIVLRPYANVREDVFSKATAFTASMLMAPTISPNYLAVKSWRFMPEASIKAKITMIGLKITRLTVRYWSGCSRFEATLWHGQPVTWRSLVIAFASE